MVLSKCDSEPCIIPKALENLFFPASAGYPVFKKWGPNQSPQQRLPGLLLYLAAEGQTLGRGAWEGNGLHALPCMYIARTLVVASFHQLLMRGLNAPHPIASQQSPDGRPWTPGGKIDFVTLSLA